MIESPRYAATNLVEREGRLLVVWNPRYGTWSLPGGLVEPEEDVKAAAARELLEETGLEAVWQQQVYEGDAPQFARGRANRVVVFWTIAGPLGRPPVEREYAGAVSWFAPADFLAWSRFGPLYTRVFASIALEGQSGRRPYERDLSAIFAEGVRIVGRDGGWR